MFNLCFCIVLLYRLYVLPLLLLPSNWRISRLQPAQLEDRCVMCNVISLISFIRGGVRIVVVRLCHPLGLRLYNCKCYYYVKCVGRGMWCRWSDVLLKTSRVRGANQFPMGIIPPCSEGERRATIPFGFPGQCSCVLCVSVIDV